MEKFSAAQFVVIARHLETIRRYSAQAREKGEAGPLLDKTKEIYLKTVRDIEVDCKNIGLVASVKAAQYLIRMLNDPATDFTSLEIPAEHLATNITWEMQELKFFHMSPGRAIFYDQAELFGIEANAKFPAIQFDMVEAGNCFAMGRGTACVFHLMRIMEVGVQRFGVRLGVTLVGEKNWQNILNEINKAIKSLPSKDPVTVLMSEVSANLYAVKLAWRNEVMHPNDTYTLEEAENILRQVKLFMSQLAAIV